MHNIPGIVNNRTPFEREYKFKKYARYHQIPVLADDSEKQSGGICLYQLWGGGLSGGDRGPVFLHKWGYWGSFVRDRG